MKKFALTTLLALSLIVLAQAESRAATSACSTVKIEILQELTLERIAFDAKLKVTNNMTGKSLDNMRVDLVIRDASGNEKGSLFFIKAPVCTGMSDVSGGGSVPGGTVAEAHWLIIPSPGAGGEDTAGQLYWVGATMTYTVGGVVQTVPINPCSITVKPEAQLYLDYFTPYQVLGDNPFTQKTEAPVPYPLAVRVMNDGFGPAKNLKITSAQPKIVENTQGLLIGFQILGSSVNDKPVTPSLAPAFGDVGSKKCATAAWQMISTLSGKFIDFKVSFSHSSELGGDLTSLLKETNAHYLVHMVKANLPGRDGLLDFLGGEVSAGIVVPTFIMESEVPPGKTDTGITDRDWSVSAVGVESVLSQPARPTTDAPEVDMTIANGKTGWVYASTEDPGRGLLKLYSVVRADGASLDPNNFWIQEYLDVNYQRKFSVNILDFRTTAGTTGAYRLVYEKPADDDVPPVTTLVYDGMYVEGADGRVYLTPSTKVLLTPTDNDGGSGVDYVMKKLSGTDTDFVDAFPIIIDAEGDYTLEYYSADRAGNVEDVKGVSLTVDDAPPSISGFSVSPASFAPGAPAGIVAARTASLTLTASDASDVLTVRLDVLDADQQVVRTIEASAVSGETLNVVWDGADGAGNIVPDGTYTLRATVTDGLGATDGDTAHTATATASVTVSGWFAGEPVDPYPGASQLHPKMSGSRVVWQDDRSGDWKIRMNDLAGGAAADISADSADCERPAIEGDTVAWQEGSGSSRIHYYTISAGVEHAVDSDPAGAYPARREERPAVSGDWIAWQDDRYGNLDIFAYNINTGETRRITSHERDQVNPAMTGGMLYWEDYRHGASEIYSYDFATGTETRLTYDDFGQTTPAVSDGTVAWTDDRDGGLDIFVKEGSGAESKLSYGAATDDQPAVNGRLVIYTDHEKGDTDTELAFITLDTGVGGLLTGAEGRQEDGSAGEGWVAWQDGRSGEFQVYAAPLAMEPTPVTVKLHRGYNLIAAGSLLASGSQTASSLINGIGAAFGVDRVMMYDSLHGRAVEAFDAGGTPGGEDFAFAPGAGLVVYAANPGTLEVAARTESPLYTLLPGTNQVGLLKVPHGYRAFDLIASIGPENIQGARKFNPETGSWETASVRDGVAGGEAVGVNFVIMPGDGLIITMKQRVDGWRP